MLDFYFILFSYESFKKIDKRLVCVFYVLSQGVALIVSATVTFTFIYSSFIVSVRN